MNILEVHNFYQQFGGEDQYFRRELSLLRSRGHYVEYYTKHNTDISNITYLQLAKKSLWNKETIIDLRKLISRERPNVLAFHNIFPLISPSAYYAAQDANLPIIQTLHNYRLICPNALLFRNGIICETCLNYKIPWPAILFSCYRSSRATSTILVSMLTVHRILKTWTKKIDLYIALTEFARQKYIKGGLPAEKIVVKPNFIYPDPGIKANRGKYVLFVGRLTQEKGLATLLNAWLLLKSKIPLKIVGDGPLADRAKQFCSTHDYVEYLGFKKHEEIYAVMDNASFLVFPSQWYEGFPGVVAEAFAKGLPIISSDIGSQGSLIKQGGTGRIFEAGNALDLAFNVEWAWSHEREVNEMSKIARQEYEKNYTAEINYHILMDIFQKAIESKLK